ncbi:MAG: multiheme c-type cytochrome [Candidatus Eiseniibacteriota bacterium]
MAGLSSITPVRAASLLLALGSVLLLACGIQRKLLVAYEVRLPAPGAPLEIALTLEGLDPRRPIALKSRAPASATRFGGVTARAGERALACTSESGPGERARYEFEAPGATSVTIHYTVAIPAPPHGARVGDGRSSVIDSAFALVRGCDAFLIPEEAARTRSPRVRFDLPADWSAYAPWIEHPVARPVDHVPAHGFEELVTTPFALGRFEERSFRIGRTTYHAYFDIGIPTEERARALETLEAVSRDLAGAFRRSLAPRYTVLIARASDAFETPTGGAWGTGQGGVLWPLTTVRLRHFAKTLANAYLLYEPSRFEFEDARDLWLVPALSELLATQSVARARGVPNEELDRILAYGYATLPATAADVLDLEAIATPRPRDELELLVAENAGPYVLRRLDRAVSETGGAGNSTGTVLAALRNATRHDRVRSFWEHVPAAARTRADAFRARFVRGGEVLDLTPNRPVNEIDDDPPAGTGRAPIERRVSLAVTAQSFGHVEPCGCKESDAGGIARRVTFVSRLRARDPGLLLLDAGSAFAEPDKSPLLDAFGRAEQAFHLESLSRMGYDALGIALTELARGPSVLASFDEGRRLPYVSANLSRLGVALAPASRIVRRGDFLVRIVGAYEPPPWLQRGSMLELALDSLEVGDPVEAVSRAVAGADEHELVIVLGELSYRAIATITARCPNVDLIVTSPDRMRGELAPGGRTGGASGFLRNAFVLYADLGEYGVKTLELGLTASGAIARADVGQVDLTTEIPEDRPTRQRLDQLYARMAQSDLAVAAVEVPFADDPVRNAGGYVGKDACASCHPAETAQWETTKHAGAYKTLLDVHRAFQPRCVACHVAGYGTKDGYALDRPSAHLANVQCETCHGPGAAHARAPARGTILRDVPESTCLSCHTPEHSDAFDYAERLLRVQHSDRARVAIGP